MLSARTGASLVGSSRVAWMLWWKGTISGASSSATLRMDL